MVGKALKRDHGPGHPVRVLVEFLSEKPKGRDVEADAEGAELPGEKIIMFRERKYKELTCVSSRN